jgi:hypothetical protein
MMMKFGLVLVVVMEALVTVFENDDNDDAEDDIVVLDVGRMVIGDVIRSIVTVTSMVIESTTSDGTKSCVHLDDECIVYLFLLLHDNLDHADESR